MFGFDEEYFNEIMQRISEIREIPVYGVVKEPGRSQVLNRSGLIFALEIILAQHRNQFGTLWNPLNGRLALEHKLLMKYKWPLSEVKRITLKDALFLLQDELKLTELPELAQRVIHNFQAQRARAIFPDVLDEEWNPSQHESIPPERHW